METHTKAVLTLVTRNRETVDAFAVADSYRSLAAQTILLAGLLSALTLSSILNYWSSSITLVAAQLGSGRRGT